MLEERPRRKLSAIPSADVKGYSRLMSQDEETTVKTLKQHRITISRLVTELRGRVVDSPGDNILAQSPHGAQSDQEERCKAQAGRRMSLTG
jgi:class 3 adenylate cyclase